MVDPQELVDSITFKFTSEHFMGVVKDYIQMKVPELAEKLDWSISVYDDDGNEANFHFDEDNLEEEEYDRVYENMPNIDDPTYFLDEVFSEYMQLPAGWNLSIRGYNNYTRGELTRVYYLEVIGKEVGFFTGVNQWGF